jgi:WD40-like Beta Propeller Repeat
MTSRPWFRRSSQVLLLVGALAGLKPTAAVASFPGGDGVIAYSAAHTVAAGIWVVDPTTGNQLQLTSAAGDEDPSFSASGNMIAFQRRERGAATIYIAQADGWQAKPLISGGQPAFSPDGRQLVFVRPTGLFLVNLTGASRVRQITFHRGDRRPRWNVKGEILFQRIGLEHEELDVVTPPSTRVSEILSYPGSEELWPEWSPDGDTISISLCTEFPAPHSLPGRNPSYVLTKGCLPRVWSPDGSRLVEPGFSWGTSLTTCPRYIPQGSADSLVRARPIAPGEFEVLGTETPSPPQVSWQPLVGGTAHFPTIACGASLIPGVELRLEPNEGAPPPEPGVQICVRSPRGHRHQRACRS